MRNHGFILTENGWSLSPAYDMNPNQYGAGLKLNISENDNSLDFSLALSVAPYFRLSENKAVIIIDKIKMVVSNWEKTATEYQIPKAEQEIMKSAFSTLSFKFVYFLA